MITFDLHLQNKIFAALFPNISRCIENFTGHEITKHKANKYIVDAIRKVIAERRIHRKAVSTLVENSYVLIYKTPKSFLR